LVEEILNIFQQLLLFTLVKNNGLDTFSLYYYRPHPFAILVPVETGFVSNKVGILGVALRDQFFKNHRRSAKAGNRDLFSAAEISNLKLTPEHKQTALIPHEKASIPGRVI
jgi:hypothetical protein